MKLNLHFTFTDLSGEDIIENGQPIYLDKSFANNLSTAANGQEPVKFYDWAIILYKTGEIDIDQADWDKLKRFVTDMKDVSNAYKAQLLSHFILN